MCFELLLGLELFGVFSPNEIMHFLGFFGMNRLIGWLTRRSSGWMQEHPTLVSEEQVDRLVCRSSGRMQYPTLVNEEPIDRLVD